MTETSHSSQVITAAQWLAEQTEPPERAVPALRQMFALSALEACEAIRMAQTFRTVRRAFG